MVRTKGISVLDGIAIGRLSVFHKEKDIPEKVVVEDMAAEQKRFETAIAEAKSQLECMYQDALQRVGAEQAAIVEVQQLMLEDEGFLEDVSSRIGEGWNADYAAWRTGIEYSETFAQMDNEYMKARSADILDVSGRVVRILMGRGDSALSAEEPVIVLAEDLSPSETIQMDESKILGFVTTGGSSNSHTSILARSLNLPSLVNTEVELLEEYDGKLAVVDGFNGEFFVDPDEAVLAELTERRQQWQEANEGLKKLIGLDNVTQDGRRVNVYCNIGNEKDVERVLEADAGGIGLFRSEFLYLGRDCLPTEEEQFKSYKAVIEAMAGKKVIIRTLDIGADKKADYLNLAAEENPALGYRAIRICLDQQDLFRTQLRAIYRASAFGTASIMFPMIISVEEIREIKRIVESVKDELRAEGIAFGEVELGIMVETPAAAVISDELAKEVEFFSIGTNDLTQYTLAIDRQNPKLDKNYNPHHEAVLRLIRMTVENGHRENIWVGICGELAGDLRLTKTFLDMGVDELSVSPSKVLQLRKTIREN